MWIQNPQMCFIICATYLEERPDCTHFPSNRILRRNDNNSEPDADKTLETVKREGLADKGHALIHLVRLDTCRHATVWMARSCEMVCVIGHGWEQTSLCSHHRHICLLVFLVHNKRPNYSFHMDLINPARGWFRVCYNETLKSSFRQKQNNLGPP